MKVEVRTNPRGDGQYDWSIAVDGVDHGGGVARSHAECYEHAAAYLRDTSELAKGPDDRVA